jgi:hypothetical protein
MAVADQLARDAKVNASREKCHAHVFKVHDFKYT